MCIFHIPGFLETCSFKYIFTFDENFNIKGGSTGIFAITDAVTGELSWNDIVAEGAPTKDTPE